MVKQAQARVFVSIAAQKTLFQDVHQRRDVEACGVLIGSMDEEGNWYIEQAHPLRNIFDSPVYFEFAPEELEECLNCAELFGAMAGLELVQLSKSGADGADVLQLVKKRWPRQVPPLYPLR